MPFQVELPPVSEERLRTTAEWIQHNVHPVADLIEIAHEGEPAQPFEVRRHQVEALAREWQAREEGQSHVLGHLATGGGKTTLWVIDAMKYREECAQSEVPMIPRFLYVSPQHEINQQAAKRLQRFIPDANVEFFDTRKAKNRPEADFTFATIQSLYSKLDTFDPEDFENIFWDEAHHLEAKTFKKVLEYFRPLFESAATATVERMDKKDIQEYWGKPIYSKGLPDGLAEGWLADVEYHIIFDKAVREEVTKGFHPKTLKEIEELFEKKVSPEALAESIREEIERLGLEDPKTMIFCESVEEADEMAGLLGGKAYHSYAEDQEQILKDFKSGRLKVVTARDMLNEGVDVPDAEVVIFLRGTKSGPLWEQQLGRGLRKILGKDKVYVLDFVANIERVAKVRELSDTVQKRAGKKGSPGGTTGGNGSINIHTKHSEFDFDTMAVDLLEKWGTLKRSNEFSNLTNDQLVALALSIKPGEPIGSKELEKLSKERRFAGRTLIDARFGSVRDFQRACGFQMRNLIELSDEELVNLALELKPDEALTYKEIMALRKNDEFVSDRIVRERFGSIAAFQRRCGFEVIVPKELTNDEIVERALELKPDEPLTTTEIIALCKDGDFVGDGTIKKRFGSIAAFHQACGFEHVSNAAKPLEGREQIVQRALEIKPDGPLGTEEIDKLSVEGKFFSRSSIQKYFGGVVEFQKACGFEPLDRNTLTRAISQNDIVKLALEISPMQVLNTTEIRKLSKEKRFVSLNKIKGCFGSMEAFRKACDNALNKAKDSPD